MKLSLLKIYDSLSNSFWFVPAVMAVLAGITALSSIALDNDLGDKWAREIAWIWSGGAEGARSVLSVISGSVITVVSIVFTITVSALAQMSSQFGPRILRNFTSDRSNQFVLGTFVATYVFCLLVLRSVRSIEEALFVPYISVNIGIALSLASLAVLIYFIHHVSQQLQADNLIADVGNDLLYAIEHLYPQQMGQAGASDDPLDDESDATLEDVDWDEAEVIESNRKGYVQGIDDTQLMRLACERNLLIKLENRPGDFALRGQPLMRVLPGNGLSPEVKDKLAKCYSFGQHRTPYQDAAYSMQQLVEVAIRALSPSINEPYTAMTCIDWIGAALRELSSRVIPSEVRSDEAGRPRLLASRLDFQSFTDIAFNQIRLYGADNPEVACHLLNMIARLAPELRRKGDLKTLSHHAWWIDKSAASHRISPERRRLEQCLRNVMRSLAKRRCEPWNKGPSEAPA
jgi:uncharacterized membrane protein